MSDLDKPRPVPRVPRLRVGGLELLPALDEVGNVIPNQWLVPCALPEANEDNPRALGQRRATQILTTDDVVQQARVSRKSCELVLN